MTAQAPPPPDHAPQGVPDAPQGAPAVGQGVPAVSAPGQNRFTQAWSTARDGSAPAWKSLAPVALGVLALLGLFSLMLPVMSAAGESVTYLSGAGDGTGTILLLLFLLTLGGAVAVFLLGATPATSPTWVRPVVGAVGILTGVLAAGAGFWSIGTFNSLEGEYGGLFALARVSLGPAPVLLAILGMLMIVVAVLTLLPPRGTAARGQVPPRPNVTPSV